MAIKFEWDPNKAKANWDKHKVSFEQARDVFKDIMALDEPDEREDYGEERSIRIGVVEGRLLVVTYTERIDEDSGDDSDAAPGLPVREQRHRRTPDRAPLAPLPAGHPASPVRRAR